MCKGLRNEQSHYSIVSDSSSVDSIMTIGAATYNGAGAALKAAIIRVDDAAVMGQVTRTTAKTMRPHNRRQSGSCGVRVSKVKK